MDIGPGDWVEYVDDALRGGEFNDVTYLHLGALYRVHAIVDGAEFEDGIGAFELVEVPDISPDGYRVCFAVDRFKPVYRPKADLIEQLSRPIVRQPEKVDA